MYLLFNSYWAYSNSTISFSNLAPDLDVFEFRALFGDGSGAVSFDIEQSAVDQTYAGQVKFDDYCKAFKLYIKWNGQRLNSTLIELRIQTPIDAKNEAQFLPEMEVNHVSLDAYDHDIEGLFSQYGEVREVKIIKTFNEYSKKYKKFAMVTMPNPREYNHAYACLHDKTILADKSSHYKRLSIHRSAMPKKREQEAAPGYFTPWNN
jgi:hypothetical protein